MLFMLTEFAVVGGGISRKASAGDQLSFASFCHSVPQGKPYVIVQCLLISITSAEARRRRRLCFCVRRFLSASGLLKKLNGIWWKSVAETEEEGRDSIVDSGSLSRIFCHQKIAVVSSFVFARWPQHHSKQSLRSLIASSYCYHRQYNRRYYKTTHPS